MLKRLLMLGLAVFFCNSATAANIVLSSENLRSSGPITSFSLCVEGYVIHVVKVSDRSLTQLQLHDSTGKPLQCDGEQTPLVSDPYR